MRKDVQVRYSRVPAPDRPARARYGVGWLKGKGVKGRGGATSDPQVVCIWTTSDVTHGDVRPAATSGNFT